MKELTEEFYSAFEGFSRKEVLEAINNLKPYVQEQIYHFYSVDSKYKTTSRTAKESISVVKRELYIKYKINLLDVFNVSEEHLRNIIETKINKTRQIILFKSYTFSNTPELKEELNNNEKKILYGIINDINVYLNLTNSIYSDRYEYENFFSLFPGTNKEYIYKALKYLSTLDRNLIHKKYGADLTNTKRVVNLTSEENIRICTCIIPKLKKCISKLEAGYDFIGIEEIFEYLTLEEIKRRVDTLLKESEKEKVYNLFGNNLTNKLLLKDTSGDKILNKKIKDKINMVKKENKRYNKVDYPTPIKPFYDIFRSFKKEDETEEKFISRVNSCIRKKQLEKLIKKYGINLDKTINDGAYTREEDKYIIKVIIPVIKVRMKRIEDNNEIKYKKLKDRLPLFATKEDFEFAISNLTNEEIELLMERYGEELNSVNYDLTREELYQIKLLIGYLQRYIYQNIKRRTGLKILYLKKIKELTTREEYLKLLENYTPEESLSIMIKLYISEIPTKQIELLTGIESELILAITKDYLEYFRKELTGYSLKNK